MFCRRLLCVIALLAPLSNAGAETAQANASVRVIAPADGTLVTESTVRVVVAAPSRPRVWLENRDITGALRRSGRRWVVELPAGAIGGFGPHHLYATLGGAFSAVRFVFGRSSARLLALSGPSVVRATGSVAIRVRLGATGSVVRGWLNGHRVDVGRAPFAAGPDSLRLGADDGLRFGRNQLTMLSFQDDGSYEEQSVSILVSRNQPLPSAGPDLSGQIGRQVALSARSSRAARTRDRLVFRWQIKGAPRGSHARLLRAGSTDPLLRPDLPGRYLLRVSVSERTRGSGGRLLGTASDFTTIDVRPEDPPVGAPLETLDDQGQVVVAGQPIAGTGGDGVNFVSLSRNDRTPASPAKTYGRDAASLAGLGKTVADLRAQGASDELVVISSPAGDAFSSQALRSLLDALAGIGVSLTGTARSELADGEAFSAIGVPGSPPGSGFANVLSQFSTDPSNPAQSGDLRGYLQYNRTFQEYGFVFSDYPPFDTRASQTARSNTMQVDGQSYTQEFSSDVPSGASGFAVLALDRTSLQPMRDPFTHEELSVAIATNSGDPTQDRTGGEDLVATLTTALHFNALVLLQSIGNPRPTTTAWNGLAQVVGELGGTVAVFNALDGTGGYALVGGRDLQPSEVSGALNHRLYPRAANPARLVGVLARNRDSAFQALLADSLAIVPQQLFSVAYQQAQEFPSFDPAVSEQATPGTKAADQYITQQLLGFKSDSDPRHEYWDAYNAAWDGKSANLNCADYPSGHGFDKGEFETVCRQLKQEITDLITVKHYIELLQAPFNNQAASYIDLQKIWRDVQGDVHPPDVNLEADTAQLISLVLSGASKVLSVSGPEGASAAAALSGVFQLAGLGMARDGAPVLGRIQAKAYDLASQTVTRFEDARDALNTLGLILVSDWGKLQAAATNIDGSWKYPASDAPIRNAFRKAIKRWYFDELLPVAFNLYALTGVRNAEDWSCKTSVPGPGPGPQPPVTYTSSPFRGEPATGQFRPIVGFNSDSTRNPPISPNQPTVLALGQNFQRVNIAEYIASPPSAHLLDPLFQPLDNDPDTNRLGLLPEIMYSHGFNVRRPPHGSQTGEACT